MYRPPPRPMLLTAVLDESPLVERLGILKDEAVGRTTQDEQLLRDVLSMTPAGSEWITREVLALVRQTFLGLGNEAVPEAPFAGAGVRFPVGKADLCAVAVEGLSKLISRWFGGTRAFERTCLRVKCLVG